MRQSLRDLAASRIAFVGIAALGLFVAAPCLGNLSIALREMVLC